MKSCTTEESKMGWITWRRILLKPRGICGVRPRLGSSWRGARHGGSCQVGGGSRVCQEQEGVGPFLAQAVPMTGRLPPPEGLERWGEALDGKMSPLSSQWPRPISKGDSPKKQRKCFSFLLTETWICFNTFASSHKTVVCLDPRHQSS